MKETKQYTQTAVVILILGFFFGFFGGNITISVEIIAVFTIIAGAFYIIGFISEQRKKNGSPSGEKRENRIVNS
jgi:hypothetical protein